MPHHKLLPTVFTGMRAMWRPCMQSLPASGTAAGDVCPSCFAAIHPSKPSKPLVAPSESSRARSRSRSPDRLPVDSDSMHSDSTDSHLESDPGAPPEVDACTHHFLTNTITGKIHAALPADPSIPEGRPICLDGQPWRTACKCYLKGGAGVYHLTDFIPATLDQCGLPACRLLLV